MKLENYVEFYFQFKGKPLLLTKEFLFSSEKDNEDFFEDTFVERLFSKNNYHILFDIFLLLNIFYVLQFQNQIRFTDSFYFVCIFSIT